MAGIRDIIGGILGPIFSVIDKAVPDATKRDELKAEVEKAVLENESKLTDAMREIAVAEVSGDKFQSSWRPLLSYICIFLMFWSAFLGPLVVGVSGLPITVVSMADLQWLVGLWTAVYGLSRWSEKTGSYVRIGKAEKGVNDG